MGVKVAKFGGSSVADIIQFKKMKEIILSDPERRYIVVSAPGKRFEGDSKITDLLYLCKTHIEHNVPYEQVFQVVADRYIALAYGLGLDLDLGPEMETIKKNLSEGASADYIASRGEYLNALVVSNFLGFDFVDAAGLVQFDEKGRFLQKETDRALGAELAKHKTAVIPGFYGTYPNGEIKTFSRGGSDISGSLVARAIGADVYENWTDVSGFLMADPRIVPGGGGSIRTISYKELRELSYMGASVLHEDAIYPARMANIPINIRNTNDPDDAGTMITADVAPSDRLVTGIAGSKDFTVIAIYKNMLSAERGYIRRILTVLEDNGLYIEHMPTGIDTISLVLPSKDLAGKQDEIVEDLKATVKPDSIEVEDGIALIATVGARMSMKTGTAARLFGALAQDGVNIRMIDQGSSEMNIIVGVKNEDFEKAIKAIYREFK